MDHELNFSADCVINFDDLGEFKDYTEIIESLVKQMKSN